MISIDEGAAENPLYKDKVIKAARKDNDTHMGRPVK